MFLRCPLQTDVQEIRVFGTCFDGFMEKFGDCRRRFGPFSEKFSVLIFGWSKFVLCGCSGKF